MRMQMGNAGMTNGWDSTHTVFSYYINDTDNRRLNSDTKRLSTIFFLVLGLPSLVGLYFGFFNPFQIPGGGVGRGALIGLLCTAPALLSLPLLREKIIGGYSRRISVAIVEAMGENDGFIDPMNEVFKRTPWSRYRIALLGGYRDIPHDIPIYLPNGNHLVVNFDEFPTIITSRGNRPSPELSDLQK